MVSIITLITHTKILIFINIYIRERQIIQKFDFNINWEKVFHSVAVWLHTGPSQKIIRPFYHLLSENYKSVFSYTTK